MTLSTACSILVFLVVFQHLLVEFTYNNPSKRYGKVCSINEILPKISQAVRFYCIEKLNETKTEGLMPKPVMLQRSMRNSYVSISIF